MPVVFSLSLLTVSSAGHQTMNRLSRLSKSERNSLVLSESENDGLLDVKFEDPWVPMSTKPDGRKHPHYSMFC